MSRAFQSIVQVDPFAGFVVLLQIVQHCILDDIERVAVVIVSISISLMADERSMGSVAPMVFPWFSLWKHRHLANRTQKHSVFTVFLKLT